jgi:transcriptional regulator GlxA family with amidase domain
MPATRSACANDVHRHDVYVEKAVAAMRKDPSRPWTVAALARVAGLSRAPFARRFREATGVSPRRWLTALRLRLACERLLDDENLALARVAIELGYSSEFALSKAFKRLHGIAPGRYRRVVLMRRMNDSTRIRAAA